MFKEEKIANKLSKLLPGNNRFIVKENNITYISNTGLEVNIHVTETRLALLKQMFALVDEKRSISNSQDLFDKISQEVEYEIERGK